MVLLDNELFLCQLTRMFQKSRKSGSVRVTMKRYDGRTKPKPCEGRKPLPDSTEYTCLMRATLRNKKISTVVHAKDINKFQMAYMCLLRGYLDGLKKMKKPKTKSKATQ
ncbi:signal recognition particle 14 kDa protein [Anabrus simplex]|uniref:signal recognition particle 14 kDa protein n=1 Tax=Anabrus simplex TaxID=316456 RepID=UPI0034DD052D